MARLNIEENFWSDSRLTRLAIKLGNEDMAIGMLIRSFKIAQKYWCNKEKPKQVIPKTLFKNEKLDILIELNWAKETENGYYIHGVEKSFNWWFEKKEAGRLGGLAKASTAKHTPSNAKQNVASLSISSSLSSNSTNNSIINNNHNSTSIDYYIYKNLNFKDDYLNIYMQGVIKPSDHFKEKWNSLENSFLQVQLDKFKNYCDATGKKYKKYDSAFDNWLHSPYANKEKNNRQWNKENKTKNPYLQDILDERENNENIKSSTL